MPANAIIYLSALRDIVQFRIIQIDSILAFFGSSSKLSDFIDLEVTPLITNQELGVETTNFWVNSSTYISVTLAMVGVWVVLRLLGLRKPEYKAKADKWHQSLFCNVLIKWTAINYLDLVIAFLCTSESKSGFQRFLGTLSTFGVFIAATSLLALIFLGKLPVSIEKRVSALYEGIHNLTVDKYQLLYFPAFMARRFMIIWVPAFVIFSASCKVLAITYINQAYIMYYFGASPHGGRTLQRLYRANEVVVLSYSYILLCFTDFVADSSARYSLGTLLVVLLGLQFALNIAFNLRSVHAKFNLRYKKSLMQRNYMSTFAEWKAAHQAKLSATLERRRRAKNSEINPVLVPDTSSSMSDSFSQAPGRGEALSMIKEEPENEEMNTYRLPQKVDMYTPSTDAKQSINTPIVLNIREQHPKPETVQVNPPSPDDQKSVSVTASQSTKGRKVQAMAVPEDSPMESHQIVLNTKKQERQAQKMHEAERSELAEHNVRKPQAAADEVSEQLRRQSEMLTRSDKTQVSYQVRRSQKTHVSSPNQRKEESTPMSFEKSEKTEVSNYGKAEES